MSTFASDNSRSKAAAVVFLLIVIAALAAGAWYLHPRFEADPPQLSLAPDAEAVGLAPLELQVTDKGAGLKSVTVTLSQGGADTPLAAEQFSPPAGEKKITVSLAKVRGVKEGPAVLRITARDASLWHWFKGNETVLEKSVTVDITPPTLDLIADDRYVNFGGVGVIVYKASADSATTGVKMGDYFFPGFAGHVKSHPEYFLALFAHPYNAPPDARPTLVATDKAGNTREMRLAYELKNVKYKKSTIALSDNFLQNKIASLIEDVAARQGTPKEQFIAVNKTLRKVNEDKITAVTKIATPQMLWQGAFAQLSNSKVEANFADYRTYTYQGEPVDSAYHLGYDLSVTRNYPVEASNAGKIAFAAPLGIYGNAVIIDHGLGLFSLYGHLSAIDVKVGDSVTQRQVLGKTGETGLAAGDHLHFGIYLAGLPVLPVEWWDQKWIDDNITPKLAGGSGQEIAQAQQAKAKKKVQAKTKTPVKHQRRR
ncbi:MAG: M23 family metallopeptidase [Betaproteobacteria bacterium]|nr:M23 family metallopeptidase [Betaproteobacteria bacterium]